MAETETFTTEIIVDPESNAGELVVADMDNDFVAEEVVVVDASGGNAINTAPQASAISAPSGKRNHNGTLDSFDASNIVEVSIFHSERLNFKFIFCFLAINISNNWPFKFLFSNLYF